MNNKTKEEIDEEFWHSILKILKTRNDEYINQRLIHASSMPKEKEEGFAACIIPELSSRDGNVYLTKFNYKIPRNYKKSITVPYLVGELSNYMFRYKPNSSETSLLITLKKVGLIKNLDASLIIVLGDKQENKLDRNSRYNTFIDVQIYHNSKWTKIQIPAHVLHQVRNITDCIVTGSGIMLFPKYAKGITLDKYLVPCDVDILTNKFISNLPLNTPVNVNDLEKYLDSTWVDFIKFTQSDCYNTGLFSRDVLKKDTVFNMDSAGNRVKDADGVPITQTTYTRLA